MGLGCPSVDVDGFATVKLCDPCLSAFEALCIKMRYTNRRILYSAVTLTFYL